MKCDWMRRHARRCAQILGPRLENSNYYCQTIVIDASMNCVQKNVEMQSAGVCFFSAAKNSTNDWSDDEDDDVIAVQRVVVANKRGQIKL